MFDKLKNVPADPLAFSRSRRFSLGRRLLESCPVYLMLAPGLLLFLIFSVYPLIWSARYMFTDYDGLNEPGWIGLDNFSRLASDEVFWQSVQNTAIYSVGKLLLTLPLALILAVILNTKFRGTKFFQSAFFVPSIMSTAVMSLVFYLIFNPYNGTVNRMLQSFHLIDTPIEWLGTGAAMLTVILVAAWAGLGNYMVLFLSGLQTIPAEMTEAAVIDGANRRQVFFSITMPMLGPVMQVILLLAIVQALKDFQSIMVLTGGGPAGQTQVANLYVYQLFFPISTGSSFSPQYGYGAAAGVVVSFIIGLITVIYLWSSRRMDHTR